MAPPTNAHSQVAFKLSNPELKKVGERVLRQLKLSADRVAAHSRDSRRFRLPEDPTSIEQILSRWFNTMPDRKREIAARQAVTQLTTPRIMAERYGDLSRIDLSALASIPSATASLGLPSVRLSPTTIANLTSLRVLGGLSPQLERSTNLALRLHKVWCENETNTVVSTPFGDIDLGQSGEDDMWLAGSTVDETGDVKQIEPIFLGEFNNRETTRYSPIKKVTRFNTTEGASFPKVYFVTIIICEKDNGKGFAKTLNQLYQETQKLVLKELSGLPAGPAWVLVGGWVYEELWDYISSAWKDIVFRPLTFRATINSLDGVWTESGRKDSTDRMFETKAPKSSYQLWFDWLLYS